LTQAEALGLTLLVEAAVGAGLGRWLGRPRWQGGLCFVAASLCTHPLVWASNQALVGFLPFVARAAVLETTVSLVEAAMARLALGASWPRALGAGFVVNGASFGVGITVWFFGLG
jgi:hypothetical protein